MAFNGPILLKRIPNDPAQRHFVRFDEYLATGGYQAYNQALTMKPEDLISIVKDSGLRGAAVRGFRAD